MLGHFLVARAVDIHLEADDPALVYKPSRGAWTHVENPGPGKDSPTSANYYHQGGYRSTSLTGASVSLTFNGSHVAFFSDLYHTHGVMEIDLDGEKTTFTTYSNLSYGTPQVKIFEADVDPSISNHIITLTNLENQTMGVDYFVYTAAFPAEYDYFRARPGLTLRGIRAPITTLSSSTTSTLFTSSTTFTTISSAFGGTNTGPGDSIPFTRPRTSKTSTFTSEPPASSGGTKTGPSDSTPSARPPTSTTTPFTSEPSASSGGTATGPRDSTPSNRPQTGGHNTGIHAPVKIAVAVGVSLAIAVALALGIGLFALWRRRIQRKGSVRLEPASTTPFRAQADPAAGSGNIKEGSRLLEDDKLVRPFMAQQPDSSAARLPSQRLDKLKAASSSSPPASEDAVPAGEQAVAPTAMELLQAQLERLRAENAMLRHVAEPPAYSDGSARSEREDQET